MDKVQVKTKGTAYMVIDDGKELKYPLQSILIENGIVWLDFGKHIFGSAGNELVGSICMGDWKYHFLFQGGVARHEATDTLDCCVPMKLEEAMKGMQLYYKPIGIFYTSPSES